MSPVVATYNVPRRRGTILVMAAVVAATLHTLLSHSLPDMGRHKIL